MALLNNIGFGPTTLGLVYLNMTMLFMMFNFLVLLWLLTRFLYKPLLSALDKRAEQIKESLDDAKKNKEDTQKELERIRKEYDDARRESFDIRQQAREIAEKEKQRIVESGRTEHDELLDKARKDMELEIERAKDALRRRVGEIGADIAMRVLQQDLNEEQRTKATSQYLDAADKL